MILFGKTDKSFKISSITKTNPKPIDQDGYPIKRFEKCLECQKEFCLTFSFSQQNYSQKHSLFFWTEQEEDKGKFYCSAHIRLIYTNLTSRKKLSLQKKRHLSSYIVQKLI